MPMVWSRLARVKAGMRTGVGRAVQMTGQLVVARAAVEVGKKRVVTKMTTNTVLVVAQWARHTIPT
jgi:hypothetical protein